MNYVSLKRDLVLIPIYSNNNAVCNWKKDDKTILTNQKEYIIVKSILNSYKSGTRNIIADCSSIITTFVFKIRNITKKLTEHPLTFIKTDLTSSSGVTTIDITL